MSMHPVSASASSEVVHNGVQYRLDTVAYTSPEFNVLETVVEVPVEEHLAAQAPKKELPEPVIFVSPEFDEIETLM